MRTCPWMVVSDCSVDGVVVSDCSVDGVVVSGCSVDRVIVSCFSVVMTVGSLCCVDTMVVVVIWSGRVSGCGSV
jgi:hypothetical protein